MLFIDREYELGVLEKAVSSSRSELVIVYGRRRIGKTFLLRFFQRLYGGVYLVVNYSDRSLILRDLSRQLNTEYNAGVGLSESFRDLYIMAIRVSERLSSKKPVIVIDEAQRLAGSGGLAELQYLWDKLLREWNVLVVLSGSVVGVMGRSLLSYESPFYGRATRILYLDQFGYREARIFMRKWDPYERVRGYSVFGGTPAYLSLIDDSYSLRENIYEHILDPSSFLHHDPLYMLTIETREPQRYLAILSAIARGKHRPGEIASYIGLPISTVSKYLYVLENALGLVKRIYPVGFEGRKKYAHYIITDNYYRFWFSHIYPRLHDPWLYTREYLDKIMKNIDKYASQTWETIAKEHLYLLNRMGEISFTKIGKWWYRDTEIDLIALDEENKVAYFIECKWAKKPVTRKHLEKLREKAGKTPWRKWIHKYIFYTLSSPTIPEKDTIVYTIEDIETLMEKHKPMVRRF